MSSHIDQARAESQHIHDMSGWEQVLCVEADKIKSDRGYAHDGSGDLTVYSSCTDLDGEFGDPLVFTEWGVSGNEDQPVLREYRHPALPSPGGVLAAREPDRKPCEHYRWVGVVPRTDGESNG